MKTGSRDFELPSETEKLPHKYILDALKEVKQAIADEVPQAFSQENEVPTGLPSLNLPHGKRYFRMQEVSRLIGVEPHVIRYWQSEFSVIRPEKSGNGHWVYARRDVELFHYVRHLLHVEKFSIQGAKKKLKNRSETPIATLQNSETLKWVAKELKTFLQWAREAQV